MTTQTIIAGIYGLFFGSFLNVVDWRFGRWREIALKRSACPHCHREIRWYDLVPVASFILLRGRCRNCQQPISWQYPLIELTTAIVTGVVWYGAAPEGLIAITQTVMLIGFCYVLILASLKDMRHMEVPDMLFVAALLLSVLYRIFGGFRESGLLDAVYGVLSTTAVFLALVIISKERWMGWGDVFLAVPIGIVLGFPKGLVWLYLSFIVGAAIGLVLIWSGKKTRKDPVPFVPILAICFLLAYLCGKAMWQQLL